MSKCHFCEKRIWFWQSKGWLNYLPKLEWHAKCFRERESAEEASRLLAEITSGRNDGWTEQAMRERLAIIEGFANPDGTGRGNWSR